MATLQPGDVVRITVWRKAELSGEFVVGGDSALRHPLYQDVKVAGVPMTTVRERLKDFLSQFETNPEFLVEPLFRVVVGGEVRSPNLYSLPRETTIPQALALAGGPTENGRLERVHLIRDGRDTRIDLTQPTSTWQSVRIRSGDQILVDRRPHFLRDYAGPIASLTSVAISLIVLIRGR